MQNAVLAKDDPNSLSWRLLNITDDQGRRAEYALDFLGHMRAAFTNQTFTTANPPVRTSCCDTDYFYDLSTAVLYKSNFRLQRMTNTFSSVDASNQWHTKLLTQNDYTFDAAGQRLTNTISSLDTNGNVVSRTEQYGYDTLNRLKTVDYGDGQTQAYSFDAMGNRLQKQDSATVTENYSYNSANMLLTRGASNYTNDADGSTLTGGGRTNTWDSQNRLVQCVNGANTSSFVYGSDGQRRQSTVNGTTTDFVLDASMFIRERNHATGVNTATYFAGARGPEYRRDETTGQVRWYVYDGLGSVLGEVDPSGNITSSRKYDIYGLVRGGSNPGGTSSHKFVGALGHPSEDNTALIYMRARYMDAATGRFISEDTVRSGTNWLAYCGSNPTNYCDPSGHFTLIDLLWTDMDNEAVEAAENKMAQHFGSWGENKIAQALSKWAEKFGQEIWEEELDGVEWTDKENLRLCGEDGRFEIRVDFSGHDGMPPHINYALNGGGVSNGLGNHWIIE